MFVDDSYGWVSLPLSIEQPKQMHCLPQIEMSTFTEDYPDLNSDFQHQSTSTENISHSNKEQNSGERVLSDRCWNVCIPLY